MTNEEKRNPATAEESDISKSQSAQQPQTGEQSKQPELSQDKSAGQPDEGLQGDTLAQQRADVEGTSQQPKERAEEESGFIGTEGEGDASAQLVQDEELDEDDEFKPDGQ